MKKTGTKDAAEAVLRELPSVLGAYVREDIHGNPREVHLLVAAGPNVRYLARDVRSLLEERLGVTVDQRIISIAQLSDDAGEAPMGEFPATGQESHTPNGPATAVASLAMPAPGRAGARSTPEDVASPGAVATVAASGLAVSEPMAAALAVSAPAAVAAPAVKQAPAMAGAAPRADVRLIYSGLETVIRDGRVQVQVRLAWRGSDFVGEGSELEAGNGRARAAASAALRAATAACGGVMRLELEAASISRVFEREFALVSAVAASPLLGRRPLSLVGAHPAEIDAETAAAIAALKAVNRVVELALRVADRAAG